MTFALAFELAFVSTFEPERRFTLSTRTAVSWIVTLSSR